MALISSMGNSSSPLFLQSGESLGLNIAPLEYYYKKKEAADEDLAKKLAQKPKLNEFDEKLNALAGQKESLKNIYNQKMGVVNKGVEKYGGIWAMYANSDEGKAAVSSLNDMTYNLQQGEDNKNRWEATNAKITTSGSNDIRFLDQKGYAEFNKNGTLTNEDKQQKRMRDHGVGDDGKLITMDMGITEGTSKDLLDEASALYTKAGKTSSESGDFMPQTVDYGNGDIRYEFGTIEGNQGEGAINYLTNVKSSSSSNREQIKSAIDVVSNSYSNKAKQGAINELYDMGEGIRGNAVKTPQFDEKGKFTGFKYEALDLKRFQNDESYHNSTINNYLSQRATEISNPFIEKSSSTVTSFQALGDGKSASTIKKEKELEQSNAYVANTLDGLVPSATSITTSGYIIDQQTGEYKPVEMVSNEFSGSAFNQAFETTNKALAENPSELSSVLGNLPFILGGQVHNPSQNTNPLIKNINKIVTREGMVKEGNSWRPVNTEENKRYLSAKESNKGINPNTLNAESLALYNKNQSDITKYGPQYYYEADAILGTDVDKVQKNYSFIDPTTKKPMEAASENLVGWNTVSDEAERAGIAKMDDKDGNESWQSKIYIPVGQSEALRFSSEKENTAVKNRIYKLMNDGSKQYFDAASSASGAISNFEQSR
jgi:hypothetical protein